MEVPVEQRHLPQVASIEAEGFLNLRAQIPSTFLFRNLVVGILYDAYMKIWSIVTIINFRDMVIGYEQERTGCS